MLVKSYLLKSEFLLIILFLPHCVNAVYHLGHVFAIVNICCFRIEYLKADTTIYISHSSFISDTITTTMLSSHFNLEMHKKLKGMHIIIATPVKYHSIPGNLTAINANFANRILLNTTEFNTSRRHHF